MYGQGAANYQAGMAQAQAQPQYDQQQQQMYANQMAQQQQYQQQAQYQQQQDYQSQQAQQMQQSQVQTAGFMESVREQERLDGARFTWNSWPCSRIEATRLIVPFGVFFTPLKPRTDIPPLMYDPVYCTRCRGVLNPYWYDPAVLVFGGSALTEFSLCSQVDFRAKTWLCCLCTQRNGVSRLD